MVEQLQQHSISDATCKMKEGVVEFKDAVAEKVTNTFQGTCESTESMIRDQPVKSVLIAFGVGALVGMLLFRR